MNRVWTLRARTALAFAVATAALTTAVLVFVALASQASLVDAFSRSEWRSGVVGSASPDGSVDVEPDPSVAAAAGGEGVAIITRASALQWQWSIVGIVAAGLLAGVVGWFVSRRMLRPIERITATTTRISASNLHERIDLGGPDDELRRLAGTIDALLGRLETAFDSQRRFVAQASHELRTPIAVQRAAIQIGLQDGATPAELAEVREQLLEHTRRSEHLVESLLVLAEAERGLDERRQPIDLAAVADDACTAAAGAARAAGVTVTCVTQGAPPGSEGTAPSGEPTLARQLLANLVDNAVEYNEPGGFVRVAVDAGGWSVENSGGRVPADEVGRLVEPFRRYGDGGARRHSGLGLSIVAAIVRAHDWAMRITPRPDGGLVVRVDVSPM